MCLDPGCQMPDSMRQEMRKPQVKQQASLKRLAIQIVGQLPEKKTDALAILAYAHQLVVEFLDKAS